MINTTHSSATGLGGARDDRRDAAAGWRRSHEIIEGDQGGKALSETLVQLARVGPGDTVLDVAGGYGEPSLTAASAVGPGGHVVCNDISGDMLAFGQERAAAARLANVEFVECDVDALDFQAGSFDAVVSRSGLMLLPDVAGTLARLREFLKPGGRLAASVWGPMPTIQMVAAMPVVFEELAVPPPPSDGPGMFALGDAGRLAALVENTGFQDVETGTITVVYEADTPEQFTQFVWSVAPAMITDLVAAQPPEVQQRVWNKVTEAYSRFQTADGRIRTENQAIWVVGFR
ncbi:MAG TPA: methyltransferase domain-containing protein [Thermomicrobiales bacterium]|nr:methyltransferase domain-containing protein [Thermomicrobiales bacterium]